MLYFVYIFFPTGSRIELTISPQTLQPNVSTPVNVTCSLLDTPVTPGSGLVGRSLTHLVHDTPDSGVGQVTSISGVGQVTSIQLSLQGHLLASITPTSPASSSQTDLAVSGHLTGSTGSLSLSWSQTSLQLQGEFLCEVHQVTNDPSSGSRDTIFSKTLRLDDVIDPMSDVRSLVKKLESRLTQQEMIISSLASENQELKKIFSSTVNCGGSGGWYKYALSSYPYTHWQAKNMTVSFNESYTQTPVVQLGLVGLDDRHDNDDDNLFDVDLLDVTVDNFTIRCQVYETYHIHSIEVSWLSLPQF